MQMFSTRFISSSDRAARQSVPCLFRDTRATRKCLQVYCVVGFGDDVGLKDEIFAVGHDKDAVLFDASCDTL